MGRAVEQFAGARSVSMLPYHPWVVQCIETELLVSYSVAEELFLLIAKLVKTAQKEQAYGVAMLAPHMVTDEQFCLIKRLFRLKQTASSGSVHEAIEKLLLNHDPLSLVRETLQLDCSFLSGPHYLEVKVSKR